MKAEQPWCLFYPSTREFHADVGLEATTGDGSESGGGIFLRALGDKDGLGGVPCGVNRPATLTVYSTCGAEIEERTGRESGIGDGDGERLALLPASSIIPNSL